MLKIKKKFSTFEREMQKPKFKKAFDESYKELQLAELLTSIMDKDDKSVRELARKAGLSPTIIQNIRSGKQEDVKLSNFINISQACGYHLVLEKKKERISLS